MDKTDNIQDFQKDCTIRKKCFRHSNMICDMLNMDPNTTQHRVCAFCIKDRNVPSYQVLSIASILKLDPKSKFPLYPLDESLMELLNYNFNLDAVWNEVDEYFQQLTDKINIIITKMRQQEITRIEKMIDEQKKAKVSLEAILSINHFQKLLLREDHISEKIIHEYIVNHYTQSLKEKQKFAKFDLSEQQFSTEKPYLIQDQVTFLVQEINMFKGNSNHLRFPTLHPQRKWTNSQLKCVPSVNCEYSQGNLTIKQTADNEIIITNNQLQTDPSVITNHNQSYLTNPLNTQSKYIIRLRYHLASNYPKLYFGLINHQDKDSKQMIYSDGIYYSEAKGGNTTKISKGNRFHFEQGMDILRTRNLEFRIDVHNKIWKVSSFPDYWNVAELSESILIDSTKSYHFAVSISNKGDSVQILEVIEVDHFDGKM